MWIQTFSGKAFYPLDPKIEDVDLADIIHALAHLCRFGGHSREFYSVAQHSVLVADIIADLGGSPEDVLAGLLHDTGEAYLIDLPRPVKLQMPDYKAAERKLENLLQQFFGLSWDREIVKRADIIALATEARDLMGNPTHWGSLAGGIVPSSRKVVPVGPEVAKILFTEALAKFQIK